MSAPQKRDCLWFYLRRVLYSVPAVFLGREPTLHPQATYYEIQFSEDGGSTWQVYSRNRDINYGVWMNHHSNFKCGFGFERCLNRRQEYTYRVRVLDSAQNPVTGWSNTLTTTSFDWPAHVNLAQPFPPGPYPNSEEVTLQVESTPSASPGRMYPLLEG